jgi:hypothetical protein
VQRVRLYGVESNGQLRMGGWLYVSITRLLRSICCSEFLCDADIHSVAQCLCNPDILAML